MTVISFFDTLLIGPLKLIFEIIFSTAYQFVSNPGLAIIFLSLIMNILVLPLYRRADAIQEEVRDAEARIHDGVAHIKKSFSGDERMMILQTYYRQNHYKPTDALKGSVSLLLQIPFFIAAYQYLSQLNVLQGVSFGPIADLSAPDGLLVLGGLSINLLPILMTLVNVASGVLYSKGFPLKTKIQLYGIALFFLVFLYAAPACLVFYWTLNNVFSLLKNIFYKLKHAKEILRFLCAAVGLALLVFGAAVYDPGSLGKKIFVIVVGLLLLLPLLLLILKKAIHLGEKESGAQPNRKLFLFGTVFLTVLIGLLIPSAFIADSPQEFLDITYFHSPLWYIVSTFCMAAGTFLIWIRVFYWLASPKVKCFFDQFVWILCGLTLVNYMFFGTDLGIVTPELQFSNGMSFSLQQQLINLLVLAAIAAVMYLCARKLKRVPSNVLLIAVIALSAMSVRNFITINTSVGRASAQLLAGNDEPHFRLSATGQNVVVFMLDHAMGEYIPYLFNERPELQEKFDGFVYYKNTISFARHTNLASPALFGGYEYTPVEMNKRKDEPLVSKHNEAIQVMPAIFSENGYEVTVCDAPYGNYQWISDLSIYDGLPGVTAYHSDGYFVDAEQKQTIIDLRHRNFFRYSVMKSMPLCIQPAIYSDGRYYQAMSAVARDDFDPSIFSDVTAVLQYVQDMTGYDESEYITQSRFGLSIATGMRAGFVSAYNVLTNLATMTDVTTDEANTFFMIKNNTTHDTMLLQEPDYVPEMFVDNTLYDAEHTDRFFVDGMELKMEEDTHAINYQCNMAAMIQLANWFDYLRENNVYDNTRIILVADHGGDLGQLEELMLDENGKYGTDVEGFFPLLMVKDFNSEGFAVSDTFMTNADVPTLAMEGLIQDPINPFTGKAINNDEKTAHDQFVIITTEWRTEVNNGNTFLPGAWAKIHDDLWDRNNWTFYDVSLVLDEYDMP